MTDLLVARAAFRDALRPRRLLTAFVLIALPSLLGLLIKALTPAKDWDPGQIYDQLAVLLVFGFVLTILSVVYGTGVVGQEVEQRTVVYLLTRPIQRWRILLAKSLVSFFMVAVIAVVALLCLALAVFGFRHMGEAGLSPDLRALLIGALAYGSIFVLLGALLPRPLLYGLLFVFGWETIVPILPGSFAKFSVMTYLRVLAAREVNDPDAAEAAGEGGPASFLMSFTRPPELAISNSQAWYTLAGIALVAMALAMVVFSRREYTPREDAE
jgi:ABC-2 type transport system permease protein